MNHAWCNSFKCSATKQVAVSFQACETASHVICMLISLGYTACGALDSLHRALNVSPGIVLLQHMQTTSRHGESTCLKGQVSERLACIAHGHWPGYVLTQGRRRQLTALLQLVEVRGSRKAMGCLACCAGYAKPHQSADPWLALATFGKPWSASLSPLPASVPVRKCSVSDKP